MSVVMVMRFLKTAAPYYSIVQQKTLAIAPKITSLLSIVGSLYIIYDVYRLPRHTQKMYHRILLGSSMSDVLASVAWTFSTSATDPDILPIWGAKGTQQTCTLQGFFAQTPLTSILYSGWLAYYYYLVIRCGWSHSQLTRSKIEWIVHSSSVILGFGTAAASAGLGILNPLGFTCWIAAVPLGCDESWLNNGVTNCERGDNSKLYQWVFWYIPLWLVIACVSVCMGSIVWKFYKQERLNDRHRRRSVGKDQAKVLKSWQHSRLGDMVWQSLYYVGSFYLTWTFPTILRVTQVMDGNVWFHWEILTAFFVPSQGIWNFLIYLRPQYIQMRQRRFKKQQKKRLTTTSLGSTASETDPRRSGTNMQPLPESEIENVTRNVKFSDEPSGSSKTEERPKGCFSAFLRELLEDLKAAVLKGDEGVDHSVKDSSCNDDSSPPSQHEKEGVGDVEPRSEGQMELDENDDDDNDIIETDDLETATEEFEVNGKQESASLKPDVLEQEPEEEVGALFEVNGKQESASLKPGVLEQEPEEEVGADGRRDDEGDEEAKGKQAPADLKRDVFKQPSEEDEEVCTNIQPSEEDEEVCTNILNQQPEEVVRTNTPKQQSEAEEQQPDEEAGTVSPKQQSEVERPDIRFEDEEEMEPVGHS